MTTLITGGSGFLGLNMAIALAERGEDVVITTRRRVHPLVAAVTAEHKQVTAVPVELTSAHEVHDLFARFSLDRVLHAVTTHHFAGTRAAASANYATLLNCLEAAQLRGVRRFVLAGSASVYRGVEGPLREDVPLPADITAGAASTYSYIPDFEVTIKRIEELLALDYGAPMAPWDLAPTLPGDNGQMQVAVLRHPWLAGRLYTSMYNPIACHVHVAAGRDRSLLDNRELLPFAAVAYIRDAVEAINTALFAESLPHRIYNLCSFAATGREFLEALYRVRPEAEQRIAIDPATVPSERLGEELDVSLIAEDLGWRPAFDLESALADWLEWLDHHEY